MEESVLGLPLSCAIERLEGKGYTVIPVSYRDPRGNVAGEDPRVVRMSVDRETGTVQVLYGFFLTTPKQPKT